MLDNYVFQCPSSKDLPVVTKNKILLCNGKNVAQRVKNFIQKSYPEDFAKLEEIGWSHCPIVFRTARKWKLNSETVGKIHFGKTQLISIVDSLK